MSTEEGRRLVEVWFSLRLDPERSMRAPRPGPGVDELSARLSEAPREFLDPRIDLAALSADVLGSAAQPAAATVAETSSPDAVAGAAVYLWLVGSAELLGDYSVPLRTQAAADVLLTLSLRVAALSPPTGWFTDARAREEAVRTVLWWSGQLPAGEDAAAARSALAVRDSLARDEALNAAREAFDHRIAVARRLQDARAREAAQRYSNE